jgi:hypothetical protein
MQINFTLNAADAPTSMLKLFQAQNLAIATL